MPPGDPAALEDAAAAIGRYAVGVGDLAAATHRTMTGIAVGAEWTGAAADAYEAWTGGLVRGVGAMEEPLARVPGAIAGYAAALRTAQNRVGDYQDYAERMTALSAVPAASASAFAQAELRALRTAAEEALAGLEIAAGNAARALGEIAETLDHVFGASGPFRAWLENSTLPWDGAAGDAVLEFLKHKGEEAVEDAERAAKWVEEGMPEEIGRLMDEILAPPLASGRLEDAIAAGARFDRAVASLEGISDDWASRPLSLLGRLLPGLKVLGGVMDAAGVIGGVYTLFSPPDYDEGIQREVIDRGAGFAEFIGGGAGLATGLSSDVAEIAVLGMPLPVVGAGLAAGAGLYLAGDWAYHHTHWIAHTFDSFRHTAAHYADDAGHGLAQGLSDITGGAL